MTAGYLLFLVVGRLLVFLGMKFAGDIKINFLNKLFSCSLCTGVWAYSIMSWLTGYYVFEDWAYIPVFSEIVTGALSSVLIYYLEMGWRAVHETLIVR